MEAPRFDPSKPFQSEGQAIQPQTTPPPFNPGAAFHVEGQQPQKPGMVAKALEPITSYWPTYQEMNQESREQIGHGVEQLTNSGQQRFDPVKDAYPPDSTAMRTAKGAGNVALGGLGFATSPINAALRTVVGKPVEEATGVPKEYTEFAAGMMLPMPKRLGIPTTSKSVAEIPQKAGLFKDATQGYNDFRAAGGAYTPEVTGALADHVASTLRKQGSYEHLAGPVHQTVDILRKEGPTTTDEVKSVLEGLSQLRVDPDKKIRRAAGIATGEITQFLSRTEPEAAAALGKANANYAAGSRANQIDQAAEISGLRSGRAGYGGNSVNTMRQVLSPIVESAIKGNAKGYSPEEIKAMHDIVVGTTATNMARGIGQLSPSKGAIQTGIALGTAGVSGAVGAVANKLATILTSKQIDRLNELVRKRSPAYEEAVSKAADKFTVAAEEFRVDPSQAKLLKAIVSSRALASGLTRDGMQVTSGDLFKTIAGQVKGAADEQQPPVGGVGGEPEN